ncbi:SGNH/GDSL hydrolase family protein [Cryobacterium algoritolerans]|uniref:SGNH/GDSL hydrolase family protein n=1 Tax=Cryobacterium algoritolerans TaxID=1259184 RepID=A0A4R8X1V2_9MICO|nr:SGNH/GDSL hydrolase family protein [Cryobacterium algoritolerans]TFC20057.1 SGNH/GDSL hydrolase family protein [Cryobacterium algoritolerans]
MTSYIRKIWADFVTGNTPITAADLNHLEQGVADVDITNPASPAAILQSATYAARTALLPSITPRLMASPPTVLVTNDTSGGTTVPTPKTLPGQSYTSILANDLTAYLPLGVGSTPPTPGSSTLGPYTAVWSPSSAGSPQIVRPSFLFDGTIFSLTLRQFASNQFRIMVDGEYVTQYPVTLGGVSNSYSEVKATFATRAVRRITVELCGTNDLFLGINFQVNDTVRALAAPKRRLVAVGDSYFGGGGTPPLGTCVSYMAQALGFQDFVNAGVGSTGWLAAGSYTNIAARLQTDVIAHNPTDVIIALGHNDTGFTNAAITAQVQAVLASIRAALPNLRSLVVTGPLFAGATPGVYAAMSTAIAAGCVASGATFVDTVPVPIFTGQGRVGATTGIGNSDLYITSDGTHPNDAGSAWLGASLARNIAAALV